MHISGIENDILNQAKQNEIKNKYIHAGQTEMLCSHLGNAYSILVSRAQSETLV